MKNLSVSWKSEKLNQVCVKISDRNHVTPKYVESGVPLISPRNFFGHEEVDWNTNKFISEIDYLEDRKKVDFIVNDIMLSRIGTIGKVRLIKEDRKFMALHSIVLVRPNKEIVSPKFLYYTLQSQNAYRQMLRGIQSVGVPDLGIDRIRNIEILFPTDLELQDQIVQEIETQFTRLDASIKSLKSVKAKLEIYRKSVLQAAFFGEQKKLSEIVSKEKYALKRGPFGGSLKKEIFVSTGYKVYEQKNAIQNDFSIGKYFVNKEKFDDMLEFKVKPRDFIVSCSGTIGKIAEIPQDAPQGIINQALLKITLDNTVVLNQYFYYLFESDYVQKHLTNISRGVAIKNVPPMKDMKNISFPIPSIDEQKIIIQNIESHFSIIDKVEQTVDASLDKAEQLRKSILKSAFEGKLVKGE